MNHISSFVAFEIRVTAIKEEKFKSKKKKMSIRSNENTASFPDASYHLDQSQLNMTNKS